MDVNKINKLSAIQLVSESSAEKNLISIKNSSIHEIRSMSILNDEFTRHYLIKELTIDILIEISCQYYKLEK